VLLRQWLAARADQQALRAKIELLTPREREVLQLLQTGMSNKQIARALDLQLSTVKNHVHSLLAKFGASDRSEVAAAVTAGPGSWARIS
jgi:DNA-binding NarL/FixJ family response regulator